MRIVAAWLAGANRMPWRRFLLWNALGGIGWAISVGIAAYLLGQVAAKVLHFFGLAGFGVVLAALAGLFLWHRIRRLRRDRLGAARPA